MSELLVSCLAIEWTGLSFQADHVMTDEQTGQGCFRSFALHVLMRRMEHLHLGRCDMLCRFGKSKISVLVVHAIRLLLVELEQLDGCLASPYFQSRCARIVELSASAIELWILLAS